MPAAVVGSMEEAHLADLESRERVTFLWGESPGRCDHILTAVGRCA